MNDTNSASSTALLAQSGATGVVSAGLHASRLVARNMAALVFSQFITTPVSILVNALLARRLGASDFGAIYLAGTVLTVGFLIVEWGGQAQVAAEVARDRSKAAEIFGTGIALRVVLGGAVLLLVPSFARLMQYDETVRIALLLCGLKVGAASLGNLCGSILRGYEKLNWYARVNVFANLVDAALVIPTLLLGGGLRAALTAQAAAAFIALILHISLTLKLQIGRPVIRKSALGLLLSGGFGFLLLDIVLKLQPYIDATFLSSLAPPETLGWHGAATRLVGVLIFPATTLTFALYPTLARLWKEDRATYDTMVGLGLRALTILGIFAGTGTIVFAHLIVGLIYGEARYAPAVWNLSILSGYILLVYGSIVIGAGIGAAGRQLHWAVAQSFCLVVSVLLDPVLIPWFQNHTGNGSLGVCVSVVVAEVAMVVAGLRILPSGVLHASMLRTLFRCLLASLAMGLVGVVLRPYPVVAIACTVVTFFGALWLMRELDATVLNLVRSLFTKTRSGAKAASPVPQVDPLSEGEVNASDLPGAR